MNLLHLEGERYDPQNLDLLEDQYDVTYLSPKDQEGLYAAVRGKDFQTIFVKLGLAIDRKVMEHLPNLQYIVTPTTGLNHIDLGYARERGIQLISLKGENQFLHTIPSTAEHTWALLLALVRNLCPATSATAGGDWRRGPFMAYELYEKTLGILGYGRLGKMVARYGRAFGMRVLAYDTDPAAFTNDHRVAGVEQVDQGTLLSQSDVLSLHIPSEPQTRHYLDARLMEQMKPGAFLINTARGEVVDETALIAALQEGRLAGAALDVLDGDSVWEKATPANHPLVNYAAHNRNLLLTPHMGGYGADSIRRTRDFITHKFLRAIKTQTPA